MDNYRRLLRYIKPLWLQLLLAIIFMVIFSLLTSAVAFLVKPALDDIFLKQDAEMLKLAVSELLLIGPSLLVEEMVEGAIAELIIGADFDPVFGKYLIIGGGGVLVELLSDSIPLLLPVERNSVLEALSELKFCTVNNNPIVGRGDF